VWDAIRLEKEGIPTAVVVHDVFAEAARKQAKAGGIPDLRLLIYSQPLPGETEDEARASARQVAEALGTFALTD
jgi:alkanesulfonate monooxygenase SsuD/methylene tetrahydromethanopterin reductase-like flavin-dependent oxidoreductase (luciferase family)